MKKLSAKILFVWVLFSLCNAPAGWTFPNASYFPKGWSLNPGTPQNISREYKIVSDGKAFTGDTYAFVRGHLRSSQESVSGGDEIEISFYARDPEGKEVSCLFYTYSLTETGSLRYSGTLTGFTRRASPEWAKFSGTVKIPSSNGD